MSPAVPRTFELTVTSEMENLTRISDFVASVAERLHLSDDDAFALQMAVDEASANVFEHAYAGRTDGKLQIRVRTEKHELIVVLHDHGAPFDPSSVRRPDPAGLPPPVLFLIVRVLP